MKRILSVLLVLIMVLSLLPAASAADKPTNAAEALYELGLFKGTGTNEDGTPIFDLDKTPTRNQAIIMLVRLLGKEEEALAGTWELPFTDVEMGSTSYYYIGYAYTNGLTAGTTETTFSGGNPIRANQYITFVLRALGYVSGEDFKVSTAWEFSDEIGLTHGEYNAANAGKFIRGNVASISADALETKQKGGDDTLAEKLMAEQVFTLQQYESALEKKNASQMPQETFTKTAFGDKDFHEMMMSYKPSEVIYGPTRSGEQRNVDTYMYKDKFLADELSDRIHQKYTVVKVLEYGGAAGMKFVGTRAQVIESGENGRYIELHTFGADGSFHCEKVVLRMWKMAE